ncbi:MAG: PQQ-binding-like beta-propeller repeat protein, partial [Sphingomonadaceae bacterium]
MMIKKSWLIAASAVATLLLGSCEKVGGPRDVPAFAVIDGDYLKTGGDGSNWAMTGFNYDEQRHSPLKLINDSNVQNLGIAWFADLPDARGQEATPVVVDGKMFVSTAWSKVLAYDAKTGKPLWSFDPEVDKARGVKACCDVVNRGVAFWKGSVFVGTIDGRLISLDASTGKQNWSAQTLDLESNGTITGVPRVVKDKVVIGFGGAEFGARGYVTA